MLVSRKVRKSSKVRRSNHQDTRIRPRRLARKAGPVATPPWSRDRGKAGGFVARSPRSLRSARPASGIQTLAAGKDLQCPSSGTVGMFSV